MLRPALTCVVGLLCLTTYNSPVLADTSSAEMQEEIKRLRSENAQYKSENHGYRQQLNMSYVEGKRADEVKAMIADVLEDTSTRNALADNSSTAGHNGNFFLSSADGKFKMIIKGKIQFRWYGNFRQEIAGSDNEISTGFDDFRTELEFRGHVFDPDIFYVVSFELNRQNVSIDNVILGYKITDNLKVQVGRGYYLTTKIGLEMATGDPFQSAVDRSLSAYVVGQTVFSSFDSAGISADYSNDWLKVRAHFINVDSSTGVLNNGYDFAARGVIKLMGNWKQYKDLTSWSGDEFALFIGAGAKYRYSTSEANYPGAGTGGTGDWTEVAWAADARMEWNGLSVWVSALGAHGMSAGDEPDYDVYAFIGQVSYNIMDTVEIFIRGEHIFVSNQDSGTPGGFGAWAGSDGASIITFGGSWFIYKHKLKLTGDVQVTFDELPVSNANVGLRADSAGSDDSDPQVVVRFQVQLLF